MIDIAVDIVNRHIAEYYPDEEFIMNKVSCSYTFYSKKRRNLGIVLDWIDNEVLFSMHSQIRKKKILEGQLRLIGGMKHSDKWDCYGYDRNI